MSPTYIIKRMSYLPTACFLPHWLFSLGRREQHCLFLTGNLSAMVDLKKIFTMDQSHNVYGQSIALRLLSKNCFLLTLLVPLGETVAAAVNHQILYFTGSGGFGGHRRGQS